MVVATPAEIVVTWRRPRLSSKTARDTEIG